MIEADGSRIRSPMSDGVRGSSAPSITAKAVATTCFTPKVASMCDSSSRMSTSPTRQSVA